MIKTDFNKMPSQRQLRVGEEIRHALSSIFMQGTIYEPELVGVSITVPEVRVSPDLRNATAFVFPLAGKAPEGFIEALNRISPQITHQVLKRAKLRFAPKIFFKIDDSFENADNIENIISKVKSEEIV
ncbi:MAG: 30S ribosome-binding factor RbfA [Rickettsiales bacterium]|nr:30S ribosome-binding factor RbfA [Pseudomonadota bacterium]MDA0966358.1 30S ribosome-binding factor RbfA [Pseudomonadota bacterium]MDG4543990.1 30S ribosome-binding factor RbfA [Rickettsiales bacterium]MDG4545484.1 30S ribosome-binding factor RbfA [Rickettsiales bacterium]MDG4547933.1 30S ribosome-binding factor RbfA [Rickettsiales bacterium]